ncbi:helix-turn-helix transcriptional regulator [Shewanella sp. AS16]|uniref:AraC family transcriptional regulator n=1 Tax=Shewanella sp. AS16 TaxID=2907625 RepID=UPI001F1CA353|nr:helix-turn-helix domain-containing protein [Shewanella sp. AS16]MCE9685490.1 helix-turn-helix transcriptional regulator [Shewanella sp. AS16]
MNVPEVEFRQSPLPQPGFEILSLESLYQRALAAPQDFAGQPHRLHFYNLLLITEGQGEHFIDFQKYQVQPGSLVIINRGQIHAFDTRSQPKGHLILFTREFLDTVTKGIEVRLFAPSQFVSNYRPCFQASAEVRQALEGLLEVIRAEFTHHRPNTAYLQLLFAALLTKVNEASPQLQHNSLSKAHAQAFERFIGLINKHLDRIHDARQYAARVGTSYKTLNGICKAATGKTAKQLIDEHRVLEAKRRLRVDNLQVQQLASALGFDEATNFVKYFKKHTSMTPNQFRKAC